LEHRRSFGDMVSLETPDDETGDNSDACFKRRSSGIMGSLACIKEQGGGGTKSFERDGGGSGFNV
jgi:hypothetical protein